MSAKETELIIVFKTDNWFSNSRLAKTIKIRDLKIQGIVFEGSKLDLN